MVGIAELLGQFLGGVAGSDNGVPGRVWAEVKPWIAALLPNATKKWLPTIAGAISCEVPVGRRGEGCDHAAVANCVVCFRPACLQHGLIDSTGDIICYPCTQEAKVLVPPARRARAAASGGRARSSAGEPPPPPHEEAARPGKPTTQQVMAALVVLGLTPSATWEQAKAAHRKLMVTYHPDKQRTAAKKAQAEVKAKEVSAAFEVLKRAFPDAR